MNIKVRVMIGFIGLCVAAVVPGTSSAQEAQARQAQVQARDPHVSPRAAAYDAKREVIVVGTVVNYSESSTSRPIGVHVTVQTPTGPVDVHLGPSSYLRANHFTLAKGESVRFVGAMSSTNTGSVLLARIAQKGSQALAVRSPQGFLVATGAARTLPAEQRAQEAQKVSAR